MANVLPTLAGKMRRSYVMWQEIVAPVIVLESVSGDGSEEGDSTPYKGKFWVYEQAIRVPFYGIYEVEKTSVEVYHLVEGRYQLLATNPQGRYTIPALGVELGLWQGSYQNVELPWLRWWDLEGNLLLTGDERAKQERERAEQERERAEEATALLLQARSRAEQLAEQLRQLGFDPDSLELS